MYSEARKIQLIEEVLKINNEAVLVKLEAVLKIAEASKKTKTESAHDFAGRISKKDAALMEAAIQEGCEQIHPDDRK